MKKGFNVLIIIFFVFLSSCANNKSFYKIIINIDHNDLEVLDKRLKLLGINNIKMNSKDLNTEFCINESLLMKKRLQTETFFNILFTNHYFEVYFVDMSFKEEVYEYIDSNYTYDIQFEPILTEPILTGIDIDKVEILDEFDLEKVRTKIKYNKIGAEKNKRAEEKYYNERITIDFLDGQFWSHGQIYIETNPYLIANQNKDIILRFNKIGKNYNNIDLKNITLLSRYNFSNPVEIIEIQKIIKE